MSNPIIISHTLNSARIDSNAVNVAGPAKRGNTIGTIVAELFGESFLKSSTPNVISTDIMNITIAPATAKELTSTLNRLSNPSPTKRKAVIIRKATTEALSALMLCPLLKKPKKIGTDPNTSIKAKSTINTLAMLAILRLIIYQIDFVF